MKWREFDRSDWRLIRTQLIWFCGALLAAGLLLLIVELFVYFSRRELEVQTQRVAELSRSAEQAQQQWLAVQQYQQQYRHLQQIGVIGSEHRLDWIEGLAQLSQQYPAWGIDYAFAPQRIKEGAVPAQGLALYASEMKIQWRARDELDLSRFATWLSQQPGQAIARDCHFKLANDIQGEGIAVDCHYDWLTIAPQRELKP